jgi:hypothetical protein
VELLTPALLAPLALALLKQVETVHMEAAEQIQI